MSYFFVENEVNVLYLVDKYKKLNSTNFSRKGQMQPIQPPEFTLEIECWNFVY